MGSGRKKMGRDQITGRRLAMLRELMGGYEKIVDDPQWISMVNIYDPKTVARYVKHGVPVSKVNAVENFISLQCRNNKRYSEYLTRNEKQTAPDASPGESSGSGGCSGKAWQLDLARLSRNQQSQFDRLIKAPYCYVPRRTVEKAVFQQLSENRKWISIEGHTGTGKTTLLYKLHEYVFEGTVMFPEMMMPILIDMAWFNNGYEIGNTPVDCLKPYHQKENCTIWELIDRMGSLAARDESRRLVVLIDNLDLGVHSADMSNLQHLLTSEGPEAMIHVISAGHPMSDNGLPDKPGTRIHLSNFSDEEAVAALNAYVHAYHEASPPIDRSNIRCGIINRFLTSSRFSDICRHPIRMRLMFETGLNRDMFSSIRRSSAYQSGLNRDQLDPIPVNNQCH